MFEIWLWNNYNEIVDVSDFYKITFRFNSKNNYEKNLK